MTRKQEKCTKRNCKKRNAVSVVWLCVKKFVLGAKNVRRRGSVIKATSLREFEIVEGG